MSFILHFSTKTEMIRYQGIRYQVSGIKVSEYQGVRVSGCQGIKVSGYQGIKVSRYQCVRVSGCHYLDWGALGHRLFLQAPDEMVLCTT